MVKRAWTGVEVEGLISPAGSDGAGVRMLEAVYGSELNVSGLVIMLGLLRLAEGGVEVSGQIRIVDSRVAGLPIEFGEDPAVPVVDDGDAALMHYGVMH